MDLDATVSLGPGVMLGESVALDIEFDVATADADEIPELRATSWTDANPGLSNDELQKEKWKQLSIGIYTFVFLVHYNTLSILGV